jgi:hypothetical protein
MASIHLYDREIFNAPGIQQPDCFMCYTGFGVEQTRFVLSESLLIDFKILDY